MGTASKNFDYNEFRPNGADSTWMPDSSLQKILLDNLILNLQVVREAMPTGSYMRVTSGVRNLVDFERLIEAGYNPSETSDHNFGLGVRLRRHSTKISVFGATYTFLSVLVI
ncbi:MAG: hypothetical protein HC773_20435 [Scytonema sp. CRU_2_7]|nr:hypothetical protein [Scytonema sp. CRU_2_7]